MTLFPHDFSTQNTVTVKMGQAILHDINLSMGALAKTKQATKARYTGWKAKAAPAPQSDSATGAVFETMLMSLLMQSLFGLPVFQGVGTDPEMVKALGFAATGLHRDAADKNTHAPARTRGTTNSNLLDAQHRRYAGALHDQSARIAQYAAMKKTIMLLLMTMMMQEEEQGKTGGGERAHGALTTSFVLSQFKQNKHSQSMACLRTLFQHQTAMTAPKFAAPCPG